MYVCIYTYIVCDTSLALAVYTPAICMHMCMIHTYMHMHIHTSSQQVQRVYEQDIKCMQDHMCIHTTNTSRSTKSKTNMKNEIWRNLYIVCIHAGINTTCMYVWPNLYI